MLKILPLIVRAPKISDAAKITLLEIMSHQGGAYPSLSELSDIRNVARSTIQLHIEELVEAKILTKTFLNETSHLEYAVDTDKLLTLCALKSYDDINPWIKSRETNVKQKPFMVQKLLMPEKKWKAVNLVCYFYSLAEKPEKINEAKLCEKRSTTYMQLLLQRFKSVDVIKKIIEYFCANYNRMGVKFSIASLFKLRKLIFYRIFSGKSQ